MTVLAVVQARMGSRRLPGKVLADVGGKPLLAFILARLETAPLDAVVVATSVADRDDPIAELCRALRVRVVRGPEEDVLARFCQVVEGHRADHVVRITADCPFADPTIVALALDTHLASRADYTSNTIVRTFPDGLDVEVATRESLLAAAADATDPEEREHVTPFIYRHPDRFHLSSFRSDEFLADERWTIDTAEDLAFVRRVVDELGERTFAWRDVLRVAPPTPRRVWTLEPTGDSTPAVRRWSLRRGSEHAGVVSLTVQAGIGFVTYRVPEALRRRASDLLRARLSADAQIARLVEDGDVGSERPT
jgi:spore coat polysaccharide biosynthesis protein SpsF